MVRDIKIGARDSALSLWQAEWVKVRLEKSWPEYQFSLMPIKSKADKMLDVALAKIGDTGLFTKELESLLLDKQIDIAVHSMKDVATFLPKGLVIGAICEREDPRDVVISYKGFAFKDLPIGAKVGTSSLRRRGQLLSLRPDLNIMDLRGNVNTRLMKMERDGLDAIILAAAGVKRMGWESKITDFLDYQVCLPAVGQGSLCVECRGDNEEVCKMTAQLDNSEARDSITAERAFLKDLDAGCQAPIGALAQIEGNNMRLLGMVASIDGKKLLRMSVAGERKNAEALGHRLAESLMEQGAERILAECRAI